MTTRNYAQLIAKELHLTENQVENTLELLNAGATVPFISRYRKEATGSLNEVQIVGIRDLCRHWISLDRRRAAVLDSIRGQHKLTVDLENRINQASTLSAIEDLYLPFRPKRTTRASVAMKRGLEPLAKIIAAQRPVSWTETAARFVDPDREIHDVEGALAGARDILSERIAENVAIRTRVRDLFRREARIISRLVDGKVDSEEKYRIYYDVNMPLSRIPSHRLLALLRGEKEGILHLDIAPDSDRALLLLRKFLIRGDNNCAEQVWMAAQDAYKRLLRPQMETEMRRFYKDRADTEAIRVFAQNLRQLLMAPALGQKTVLAIDPGFRTGCKLVVLDPQGRLLHNETIYPHPPEAQYKSSSDVLKRLVLQYHVEAIAIGNGTAGRETENFVRKIPFERDVKIIMVNEDGASVYSTSAIAREEFPDYDVTVRGAISIGRRLMDPLAELVKIDPKSIGVGQYQHDVDQIRLQASLRECVESCVNSVGVELNTASRELLSYVSGIGSALAKNIVACRDARGPFLSRESLKTVPRFGPKAFEQAAGFLRIRESANPLDHSAVHPESYSIVNAMATRMHCTVDDLLVKESLRNDIPLSEFITPVVGLPTLRDILLELAKPGRDPREEFEIFKFDGSVRTIYDLQPGMILPGIVTNITNFGCFVDIGIHQAGLVHVSRLAGHYVSNPREVVRLNQKVTVKVLDVEPERRRINLSMKDVP